MNPTPQTPPTLANIALDIGAIEAALDRASVGYQLFDEPNDHQTHYDLRTLQSLRDQLPQLFADAGAYREMVAKGPVATVEHGHMVEAIFTRKSEYGLKLPAGTKLYALPTTAPAKS